MLALAVVLSTLYTRVLRQARRYEVVGPRATARQLRPLGVWRIPALLLVTAYFCLSLVLPFLTLVWTALLPFLQPPSAAAFAHLSLDNFDNLPWTLIQQTAVNTVLLMASVPTVALVLSLSFSWVVLRSRLPGRLAFDYVAFLPQAVPSIVFALSALVVFLFILPAGLGLYGTVVPIIVVMSLVYLAFGTRVTNGAMIQIHPELEEAAAVGGGNRITLLLRIVLPLMRPALTYSWLWMALLAFRELTVTNMLAGRNGTTLAVVTYSLFAAGNWGEAACLALIMVAVLLPLVAIYLRLAGSGGAAYGGVAAAPVR
jgi:iron(III) transport system permease protein